MKKPKRDLVFLFDVDNTLLDNDRIQRDLYHHLARSYGSRVCERYIAIFEELRKDIGYADYVGARALPARAPARPTAVTCCKLASGLSVCQAALSACFRSHSKG
jgi:hypothetical protein